MLLISLGNQKKVTKVNKIIDEENKLLNVSPLLLAKVPFFF
jgi:hypothetical protein